MLSHRTLNTQPVKQNISPDSILRSPGKQNHTIKYLLSPLKQHNVSIPSQLLDPVKDKNPACQFTLNQVEVNDSKETKTLKIQLSDAQFEFKKIEEDFAEYKVINRIEREKLIKKYVAEIQQLKNKIQQDNSNWQRRYTEKCQLFIAQKHIFQQELLRQHEQKSKSVIHSIKTQQQKKTYHLQKQLKTLQKQLQQKQTLIQRQKQEIVQQLQQKNQNLIKQIKASSVEKQQEITKKLQANIQAIETQRRIESQKHEETSILKQCQKKQLKNQIYCLHKDKEQLMAQIKTKERKIMHLQMAIIAKQRVLILTAQQGEKQRTKIEQGCQQIIRQIKNQQAREIAQIKRYHLDQLDSYYQRINNLDHRKMTIQGQYRDQMGIISRKFSQRVSKPQDADEIQKLKTLLMLKDRQLQRYQEQLKRSEMQRQNNQKNYNKIFTTRSSRRKSANTHRDKQAFFRQANTTDLKIILKICNKDF